MAGAGGIVLQQSQQALGDGGKGGATSTGNTKFREFYLTHGQVEGSGLRVEGEAACDIAVESKGGAQRVASQPIVASGHTSS